LIILLKKRKNDKRRRKKKMKKVAEIWIDEDGLYKVGNVVGNTHFDALMHILYFMQQAGEVICKDFIKEEK